MNILVIEPHPEFGGGMERFSLDLSRQLARRGHNIYLAYQRPGSMSAAYDAITAGSLVLDLPGFPIRKPVRIGRQLWKLARFIRRTGINAIFSSHLGFLRVAAALKIVTGVRACFHLGLPALDCSRSVKMAVRFLWGVAPSDGTRQTWAATGWADEQLYVVRNFVDPEIFCPTPDKTSLRKKLGLPVERTLIGYIGRIVPEKGVATLIDAFNAIAPYTNADLFIMGRGDRSYVENLRSLVSQRDRLILRGPSASAEAYFAALDLLCIPSEWDEPFSLATVEAMAAGVPVVCTDVGILRNLVGPENAEFVVEPENAKALADALLRLLKSENLTSRGIALRQRAIELFGPSDVVDAYERILSGVLGAGTIAKQSHCKSNILNGIGL